MVIVARQIILFVLICFGCGLLYGQDAPDLKPNQRFRIPFPDLPPSIFASRVNPKIPTGVFVQLPANYDKASKFPLFVYLSGGDGGNSDSVDFPRQIIGDQDYIVANFPLFRKPGYDRDSYLDGIIVGMDDYQTISNAYALILQKLNQTIPNIDPKRSVIGGHSNGAKTVNVLLSAMDKTALESFRGFFFVDGGFTWSSYCRTNELKNHQILFLVGGGNKDSSLGRNYIVARMKALDEFAKERGRDNWRFVIMPGREHEFASEYHNIIRNWARAIQPGKVNFSGTWIYNADKSQLGLDQLSQLKSGIFRIVHNEPNFQLSRTFDINGEKHHLSFELKTDGTELKSERGDQELVSRLNWDDDVLIFVTNKKGPQGEGVNRVRYQLQQEGEVLVADEKFESKALSYHNVWVFDRQ